MDEFGRRPIRIERMTGHHRRPRPDARHLQAQVPGRSGGSVRSRHDRDSDSKSDCCDDLDQSVTVHIGNYAGDDERAPGIDDACFFTSCNVWIRSGARRCDDLHDRGRVGGNQRGRCDDAGKHG